MSEENVKILIIRLSSIGDILLATPFIRQVRRKFPNAQIDFIIKKEFEELLVENPNIDNLISFDINLGISGLIKLRQLLSGNKYNYVFDLHNNLRSIFVRRGIKSDFENAIIKEKLIQSLLVYFKIYKYKNITPIAERYLNVGKPAGIEDDGKGLEIFWNKRIENSVKEIFHKPGIKPGDHFMTIAPGAGFYTKKWPLEYYQQLINFLLNQLDWTNTTNDKSEIPVLKGNNHLNPPLKGGLRDVKPVTQSASGIPKTNNFHINQYKKKIIILGSSSEKIEGSILSKISGVIDLTGKLSLLQTAVVLSQSQGLVANDTGLMHLATAVKTPVLAIFGSTVKEFGFFPYRSKSIVVENNDIDCRPCSHIGRNKCPKKHFRCMKELYPEFVIEQLEQLLKN